MLGFTSHSVANCNPIANIQTRTTMYEAKLYRYGRHAKQRPIKFTTLLRNVVILMKIPSFLRFLLTALRSLG